MLSQLSYLTIVAEVGFEPTCLKQAEDFKSILVFIAAKVSYDTPNGVSLCVHHFAIPPFVC